MTNSNDNIEQVFNKGLNNLELEVSSNVWENIDSELFGTDMAKVETESWAKIFTMGFVPMAILISSTLLVNQEPEDQSEQIAVITIVETVNEEKKIVEVESEIIYDYEEFNGEVEFVNDEEDEDIEAEISNNKQVEKSFDEQDTSVEKVAEKKQTPSLSDTPYFNNDYYKGKGSRTYSKYSIDKLKKGVLIVRLKTNKKGIDAMLSMGLEKKAQKAQRQIDADNKAIINAFKDMYSFSDVYFFYSNNTQNVRDMKFENIFLDENLKVDKSIKLNPLYTFYMIGDFDKVRTLNDKGEYDGSSSLISRAIVMKDRDLEQMPRPFPFYIKAGNKNQIQNHVFNLNQQLNWFYNSMR